jgi:hypothetical protein
MLSETALLGSRTRLLDGTHYREMCPRENALPPASWLSGRARHSMLCGVDVEQALRSIHHLFSSRFHPIISAPPTFQLPAIQGILLVSARLFWLSRVSCYLAVIWRCLCSSSACTAIDTFRNASADCNSRVSSYSTEQASTTILQLSG